MSDPGKPSLLSLSISLPEKQPDVGPIFSVVMDDAGNLYCSDEFNHSVFSLDAQGHLRWLRCTRGSDPGNFNYPRGLALGFVTCRDLDYPCLAVSDAWNSRIQFLDLEGNFLTLWNNTGGTAMKELSDVRFIAENERGESYWLVLDRGNHRVCACNKEGSLLFQVGRQWPPSARRHWSDFQLMFWDGLTEPGQFPAYAPYDGLYYPERILGSTEGCPLLWESSSRTCLIIANGNAIPLHVEKYADGIGIAADLEGMVEWSPSRSTLRWQGLDGSLLDEMVIPGRPVFSNLPSASVWIQQDQKLVLTNRRNEGTRISSLSHHSPLLLRAAARAMESLDTDLMKKAAGSVRATVKEMKALGREAVKMMDGANESAEDLTQAKQRIEKLPQEFQACTLAVQESAHLLCLAALAMRLANLGNDETRSNEVFLRWREASQFLVSSLYQDFLDIVDARDDIELHRWLLTAKRFRQRKTDLQLPLLLEQLQSILEVMKSRLHRWWTPSNSPRHESSATPTEPIIGSIGIPHRRIGHGHASRVLTEIDRIQFEDASGASLAGPMFLTPLGAGTFFVSFFTSGHVAELTPDGRIKQLIGAGKTRVRGFQGPAGLALDERQRLWVAESNAGQIRIIDPPYDGPGRVLSVESEEASLSFPIGLCAWQGGILVADAKENLLMRISLEGRSDVFIDAIGHGSGEVRCPTTLCRDEAAPAGFWVVDKFNHRLQHLDSQLHITRQVGGLGLDKGKLFYPYGVGILHDRTLAVSQLGEPWALKLFSEFGEEIGALLLDYSPTGILVHADKIYVAATDRNSIYVYERR
jgi:hypothetical protein